MGKSKSHPCRHPTKAIRVVAWLRDKPLLIECKKCGEGWRAPSVQGAGDVQVIQASTRSRV